MSAPAVGERPTVTVVIPTYDRPELAGRAARLALAQTGVDVEVIVVDDASPSITADELRRFLPAEATIHRMEVNGGVSRARNAGLARAGGRWVTFLDDDDVIAPDRIANQVGACVRADRAWAISAVCVVDEDLLPIRIDRLEPEVGIARRLLTEYTLPAVMSNVLVRADAAERVGELDTRFAHNADWDYVTRLALVGDPAWVATPDVGYVLHSRNVSGRPTGKYEDLALFEEKFAGDRQRLGAPSSVVHSLRWIGMSSGRFGQRAAARHAYLTAFRHSGSPGDLARAAAVHLPRYASLMDRRQRRAPLAARAGDLLWLAELRRQSTAERAARRTATGVAR